MATTMNEDFQETCFYLKRREVEARLRFVDNFDESIVTIDLFSPSDTDVVMPTDEERPEWLDRYINAHRIAEENREYMRRWLTKIPLKRLIENIRSGYLEEMDVLRMANKHKDIEELFDFAIEYEDPLYLVNAYTAATPFFGQLNRDLAKRGSEFRFERDLPIEYQDDQPPSNLGQYLFAAILTHHSSLKSYHYTGTIYRGMNLTRRELQQYVPGTRILTRSFLSASKNTNVPALFLAFNNLNMLPALFVYQVTQACSCLSISSLSTFNEEDEVIIHPFVAFTVEKIEIDSFQFEGNFATRVFLNEIHTNNSIYNQHVNPVSDENASKEDKTPFESRISSNLQEKRCRVQPLFQCLRILNEKFSSPLSLYIQKCLSIHSHIRVSVPSQNLHDLTLRLFGPHMKWNCNCIEIQQKLLDQLSIPLENMCRFLIPDNTFPFERRQIEHRLLNTRADALDNGELYRLIAETPFLPRLTERGDALNADLVVDVVDVIRQKRWIVVLGDPGSGKSTFARWLTMICARQFKRQNEQPEDPCDAFLLGITRLPILVRADEIAKALVSNPLLSLFDYLCQPTWFGEALVAEHQDFIRDYVRHGHALVIIDGLDEIFSTRRRQHIASLIHDFAQEYVLSPKSSVSAFDDASLVQLTSDDEPSNSGGNQLIVTSRIVGYYAQPLAGDFISHYILAPFLKDTVNLFIDHWFENVQYAIMRMLSSNVSNTEQEITENTLCVNSRRISNELKEEIAQNDTLSYLTSNPMLLSVVCSLGLETPIKHLPRKRIHLFYATVGSMLRVWQTRDTNISLPILIHLLADFAMYIFQNSSSGLVEEFDLIGNCRTSLKIYQAHFHLSSKSSKQDCEIIADFVRMISQNLGLFVPRGLCVYGFSHLIFQEYFTCLYLVRLIATETLDSMTHLTINEVVNKFRRHITDSRLRIPLLLGLSWISWKWSIENYNLFCEHLLSVDDERFNSRLPLCSILLLSAIPELERLPSPNVIFLALNRFIAACLTNDWIERYEFFLQYFVSSLGNLPADLVAEWIYSFMKSSSSKNMDKIIKILLKLFKNKSMIPQWIDRRICSFLSEQLCTDDVKGEYTIDRTLARVSRLSCDLLPSPKGSLREYLLTHCVQIESIHPALLATIIALNGGLHRFINAEGQVNVQFSIFNMHRHSSFVFDLICCLTGLQDLKSLCESCRTKIEATDLNDKSTPTVDLFVTWFCLQGLEQPWLFEPFVLRPAFSIAVARFKRLACYLHDLFVSDDYGRKSELPSVFKSQATAIIEQYTRLHILTDNDIESATSKKTANETLLSFIESVALSLARLTRKFPCPDLDAPPDFGSQTEEDNEETSKEPMLDVELPEIFQSVGFMSNLCGILSNKMSVSVMLANLIDLVCIRSNLDSIEVCIDDFEPDAMYFFNEMHVLLLYRDNISLFLACLPRNLRPLFGSLVDASTMNKCRLSIVCVLIEVLFYIENLKNNPICCGGLLAILRYHFYNHSCSSCFQAFLYTITEREVFTYFLKFDRMISTIDDQSNMFSMIEDQDEVKVLKLNEMLAAEYQHVEITRQHYDELQQQCFESLFDHGIDLELYKIAISIAAIYRAKYEMTKEQIFSIVDESFKIAVLITNPMLKVHALSIIFRYVSYARDSLGFIFKSPRLCTDEQKDLIRAEIMQSSMSSIFNLPIEVHAFMVIQCCLLYDQNNLIDQNVINQLLDRIRNEGKQHSIEAQQAIYTALLFLDDSTFPLLRQRIYRCMRETLSPSELNVGAICGFHSTVYNQIFSTFNPPLVNILLPAMYLIELSIDICLLPIWFKNENDNHEDASIIKCVSLIKKNLSSLSREAAVAIDRFLMWQSRSNVNESEICQLEQVLRLVEDDNMDTDCPVKEWFKYSNHPRFRSFSYYAAFFLINANQYDLCTLKICFELSYHPIDYFRMRAQRFLSFSEVTTSHFGIHMLTDLIQMLLDYRLHSACVSDISTNVIINIDCDAYVDILVNWELERIKLRANTFESNESETIISLEHGLVLTNQNSTVSLFQFNFKILSEDAENRFVDYMNRTIKRLTEIDHGNLQQLTYDQQLIIELLKYVARQWHFEWYQYTSWSQVTTECLIENLARLISNCSIPSVTESASLSLRCCPSGKVIAQKHLERFLKRSLNNDDKEENMEWLEVLAVEGTTLPTTTRAIIASRFCQYLISNKTEDDNVLLQFEERFPIECYHILLYVADDQQSFPQIRERLCKLIVKHAGILLNTFANDLFTSMNRFTNQLQLENTHSTYLLVGIEVLCQMPTAFRLAIETNYIKEEHFKRALVYTSKQTDVTRRMACVELLSIYGDLTVDLTEMFLDAAWNRTFILDDVFKSISQIRRVVSRDIVERLIMSIADVSFQRRYIAALILIQLAQNNEVSSFEVHKILTQAADEPLSRTERVYIGEGFGKHSSTFFERKETQEYFDQALFSLLIKLSFVEEELKSSDVKLLPSNVMTIDEHVETIQMAGNKYASYVFWRTGSVKHLSND